EPLAHLAVRACRVRAEDRRADAHQRNHREGGEREPPVEDEEQDRGAMSVSVFWTRLETPSVTSWSSASTSFVRRLMITPARCRSKKPSESRCRCLKSIVRRSASMRSPTQPVRYVCA